MVQTHRIAGYDAFCKFFDQFDPEGQEVFVYFSGSKLPSGESWCEDCVRASPIVEKSLEKADPNSHFVYVDVGDRPTWKDMNCPFRKDSRTKLMVIPTLMKWKGHQKLSGSQLENSDLLEMLFADED